MFNMEKEECNMCEGNYPRDSMQGFSFNPSLSINRVTGDTFYIANKKFLCEKCFLIRRAELYIGDK